MNKTITNTVIQLEFLKVEEGETTLVTIPAECDREEFARIIRHYLHDGRTVLTDCHIDHEFRQAEPDREEYDDPIDMVMSMTDPGEDWTLEDAGHILGEAIAQGWHFAPDVDVQFILDIYNDLNNEEEDE